MQVQKARADFAHKELESKLCNSFAIYRCSVSRSAVSQERRRNGIDLDQNYVTSDNIFLRQRYQPKLLETMRGKRNIG